MSNELLAGKVLTGYHREDTFIATRKYMGGRPVFHLDMSISQLTIGVEAPPIGVEQDDNRIVDENRGKLFRDYVADNEEWASPSLLLWCPRGVLEFNPITELNALVDEAVSVFGVLQVPRNARQSIRILDGQHRILGFHLWIQRLNKELVDARLHLSEAMKAGNSAVIEKAKERVEKAEFQLDRSNQESIGIDILICDSAKEARQIFADIANNAKGMVKALSIGFDQSKIVNRVTSVVATDNPHPLLADRVDFNKDRVAGNSTFLISAKTLADSVRALSVGITGRVSRNQEIGRMDGEFERKARQFLDAVGEAFSTDFKLTPSEMRQKSLLGSGTFFRVLAGVWFELTSTTDTNGKPIKAKMTSSDALAFFKKLAPYTAIPLKIDSGWLTTGAFPSPAKGVVVTAPSSRNQDLKL
ncbi:MAG: hypothetical protein RIQ39_150, partial [Actinomycetota bacterium]